MIFLPKLKKSLEKPKKINENDKKTKQKKYSQGLELQYLEAE